MKKISLQNVIWKEGKYYVAQCISVDVSSFGKTKKEALKNLKEALSLYFEDSSVKSILPIESVEILSETISYA